MHVTVVVPAYNTAVFISECLRSILNQTYRDFDIIVVDDGSTDRTASIVQRFFSEGPISLLRLSKHANVTEATARGIKASIGPIITIVDSDDQILPNSLASVVPCFSDPFVGFAWSMFYINNSQREGWSHPLPSGQTLWQAMCTGWWKAAHQKFFRKATYLKTPGLNSTFDRSSDYQLVMLLATTNCKTVHVPVPTYLYRQNRIGSLTLQGAIKQREVAKKIKAWIQQTIRKA